MEKQELIKKLIHVESLLVSLENSHNELLKIEEMIANHTAKKEHLPTFGQRCLRVFLLCCYIIPGIIYSISLKHNINKTIQECEEQIYILQKRAQELKYELVTKYDEITASGILNILSEEYMQSNLLNKLISYLRLGRADTMKEALNLLEEEFHRNNIEYIQHQVLSELKHNNNLSTTNNILTAINTFNNLSKN